MHVVAKIIISESLYFLDWREVLLHLHCELTFQLCLVNLYSVIWILLLGQLYILKVVFVLKVFIKPISHFYPPEHVFNPLSLLF